MKFLFSTSLYAMAFALSAACIVSAAPTRDRLQMQLVTQDVGWTASEHKLFWTTDGGTYWRNITPPNIPSEGIVSVFFVDSSVGWVLLSQTTHSEARFDLASTVNSGESWLVNPLLITDIQPILADELAGNGSIMFVDRLNGWMVLNEISSAPAHFGIVLATHDGGVTWGLTPGQPRTGGTVRFINREDGWVLSPDGDDLYVTHDGAKTWQKISLGAPAEAGPTISATYDLPVFGGATHGYLPVTYAGREGSGLKLVAFVTDDAGRTWKPDGIMSDLPEIYHGMSFPATITGSQLLTVIASDRSFKLSRTGPGRTLTSAASNAVSANVLGTSEVSTILQLSFAGPDRGWALAIVHNCAPAIGSCTQLFSTYDGGLNWVNVTPPDLRAQPVKSTPTQLPSGSLNQRLGTSPSTSVWKKPFSPLAATGR